MGSSRPLPASAAESKAVLDVLLGDGLRVMSAPLVRGSELAFRMTVRRHGIRVCYTPMLKAELLLQGGAEELALLHESCESDRPLVVQLCGRDAVELAAAVRLAVAARDIDAVDLNLGCPQPCAERGRYGAFLQEEPATAAACVSAMCEAASPLPVFCKTRILCTVDETVAFAQCLQEAGCSLLTLHCRQRGARHDGAPEYAHLAAVTSALRIPVVANGGISSVAEANAVMARTGAAAAMAATALLRCPRAFSQKIDEQEWDAVDMAMEYLDFAERFPPPSPLYMRKHLRWLFRDRLQKSYVSARADWLEGKAKDQAGWEAQAWAFMEQPCLTELWQFRELVRFIAHRSGALGGEESEVLSLGEIGRGLRCTDSLFALEDAVDAADEDSEEPSGAWLFESE